MTTKILALTDALGNLVRFQLLPGHRFDTVGVAPLIEGVEFGALLADKAFDSNDIMQNSTSVARRSSSHSTRAASFPSRSMPRSTNGVTSSKTSSAN